MTHPNYEFGKDGWIFYRLSPESSRADFVEEFCTYLKKVQDYCEERDIPFIYCLNPSKITVYDEYLPNYYSYKNLFNKTFIKSLEAHGINYVDNTEYLRNTKHITQIFNKKYDPRHWNDYGAFYGTNNLLAKVKEYFPNVELQELENFTKDSTIEQYLPQSEIEINEKIPLLTPKKLIIQTYMNTITGLT